MTKLTDEDIMSVINNQRMSDNLLSYFMIGLWVICIGFCIFETVVRILMIIRKQKNLKTVDNVNSEPMSTESSTVTKNESDSSSFEPVFPWFGDLERVHIKRASKIIANMITDRKMESSLS